MHPCNILEGVLQHKNTSYTKALNHPFSLHYVRTTSKPGVSNLRLEGQTRQRFPSHLGKCECDPIVIGFTASFSF